MALRETHFWLLDRENSVKRGEKKEKKKKEEKKKRSARKAKVWKSCMEIVWNTSMETMCLELWYGIGWSYLSKLG